MIHAARQVVEDLFGPPEFRPFAVRYWDGTTETPRRQARLTLEIRSAAALRRMLLPPSELSIAEAFLTGGVDVHGDLESAADLGDGVLARINRPRAALRLLRHLMALPQDDGARDPHARPATARPRAARGLVRFGRRHSPRRDAHAVRFHYDLGNDFFALWLDRQMVYSCAYFEDGDESLDLAQLKKLDHVCRKLRLRAGERFLDIGCGWGALVIHAARHYGVRAAGITLSEQQAVLARERVEREGLGDRIAIDVRDYRTLGADERYDKIASVGMVEHVGESRLPDYFAAVYRALAPGGLFLNHGIVSLEDGRRAGLRRSVGRWLWRRDQFIRRYVFPDGRLVPAEAVVRNAEREGFELRDVESLREHYVMTLRHWVQRLEECHEAVQAAAGEVVYRVWRLYMAASAYAFRVGRIGVIQSLLAKPDAGGQVSLPLNRRDLYAAVAD